MGKKVLKIPLDDLFDVLSGKNNLTSLYSVDENMMKDCFPEDARIVSGYLAFESHILCLVVESEEFGETDRGWVLPDVFLGSIPKEILDNED